GRYALAGMDTCDDAASVPPDPSLLHDPPRPRRILHLLCHRHSTPPATSVTTGNLNVCPTRSRPGSTPGLASRIAATICPVWASGQHVSAIRHSVSPGITTHSAGQDQETGSGSGSVT